MSSVLLKAEEVEQVEREILQCIKEGVQCQEKAVAILRFYNVCVSASVSLRP